MNVLVAAGDLVQINVFDVKANVLCLFMMEKMNIKLVNALQNVPKDSFKLKVGSKKGILYLTEGDALIMHLTYRI